MNDNIFGHDRFDVYRLSIDDVARSFVLAKDLSGSHRHARDQWLRAARSIPLNIAGGLRQGQVLFSGQAGRRGTIG